MCCFLASCSYFLKPKDKNNFLNGVVYKKPTTKLINFALTDTLLNKVNFKNLLNKHKYFFVSYASPYTWAGCSGQNVSLLNNLARKYPGRVILIVENTYYKETMLDIRKANFNKNVIVLLDENAKNIKKFCGKNNNFRLKWYFVLNKSGYVKMVKTNNGKFKISKSQGEFLLNYIKEKISN